ncbi:DUF6115 domain-containing protein [Thermodesulfobacterium hydrogeniphilum]|uniref:DUF6115 domain-containing protein n=1 Tax=Thermodesulfobacterium hydrogeniphilum TaxID=161156 RepID=UPI00056E74DC|nr:response regulator transcription factor [Thermodesulfobacterium hydrogeniphilum]
MENFTDFFLIILLIIDFLMIGVFIIFYIRFKKVLKLPWEEIKESIEKAYELVNILEQIKKTNSNVPSKNADLKEKVYKLFQNGYSSKEIAKKLKISEAEVELILASKKMKF